MKGTIYHAQQGFHIAPLFTFVPDELVKNGKLDVEMYVNTQWASINCAANPTSIGSHLFPDLTRPALPEECPVFLKELQRFVHKSYGTPSEVKLPGLNKPLPPSGR